MDPKALSNNGNEVFCGSGIEGFGARDRFGHKSTICSAKLKQRFFFTGLGGSSNIDIQYQIE